MRLQERNLVAGELQIGEALSQIPTRLLHGRFIRPQIQDIENLSGLHLSPRPEEPFLDVSFDPAAYLYHVARVGLRGELRENWSVGGLYLHHQHRRGRKFRGTSLLPGCGASCQQQAGAKHRAQRPARNTADLPRNGLPFLCQSDHAHSLPMAAKMVDTTTSSPAFELTSRS